MPYASESQPIHAFGGCPAMRRTNRRLLRARDGEAVANVHGRNRGAPMRGRFESSLSCTDGVG